MLRQYVSVIQESNCNAFCVESRPHQLTEEELAMLSEGDRKRFLEMDEHPLGENSMVVELEKDMLTTKGKPYVLIPGEGHSEGTDCSGHGFFYSIFN